MRGRTRIKRRGGEQGTGVTEELGDEVSATEIDLAGFDGELCHSIEALDTLGNITLGTKSTYNYYQFKYFKCFCYQCVIRISK